MSEIERQLDAVDFEIGKPDAQTMRDLRLDGLLSGSNTRRRPGWVPITALVPPDVAAMTDQLARRYGLRSRAEAMALAVRYITRCLVRAERGLEYRQRMRAQKASCADPKD